MTSYPRRGSETNFRYTQSYPFGVQTANPQRRLALGSRNRPSSTSHAASGVYVNSSTANHARFVPRRRSNSSTDRQRTRDPVSAIVSTLSPLLYSYGMKLTFRISNSVVSVASLSMGYVGAPSRPTRPLFM